jgi:hypothetical protein
VRVYPSRFQVAFESRANDFDEPEITLPAKEVNSRVVSHDAARACAAVESAPRDNTLCTGNARDPLGGPMKPGPNGRSRALQQSATLTCVISHVRHRSGNRKAAERVSHPASLSLLTDPWAPRAEREATGSKTRNDTVVLGFLCASSPAASLEAWWWMETPDRASIHVAATWLLVKRGNELATGAKRVATWQHFPTRRGAHRRTHEEALLRGPLVS